MFQANKKKKRAQALSSDEDDEEDDEEKAREEMKGFIAVSSRCIPFIYFSEFRTFNLGRC